MEPTQPPSLNFNPETALNYAQKLARPRRVGSGEDKIVAGELAEHLTAFGYQVERQGFQVSSAPGIFITAEILLSQLLIILILALQNSGSGYSILASLALLLVLAGSGPLNKAVQAGSVLPDEGPEPRMWSRICSRLGDIYSTENILASLPSTSAPPSVPHLYLIAHYDSKSQRISLPIRVLLFALVIPGAFLFSALALLGTAIPALNPITVGLGGVVTLCSLPLLALDFGNRSPGAIDNASGVGTVLQLAESLSINSGQLDRLKPIILFTGAEEFSLMGAQAFVQRHEDELRNQVENGGVHILNIDGTGITGQLYFAGQKISAAQPSGKCLSVFLGEAQDALRIRIKRFSLPGALFDHAPFADRGFDALTLLTVGGSSWAVHTARDTPDKLNNTGFAQIGRVVSDIIEKLAKTNRQESDYNQP